MTEQPLTLTPEQQVEVALVLAASERWLAFYAQVACPESALLTRLQTACARLRAWLPAEVTP